MTGMLQKKLIKLTTCGPSNFQDEKKTRDG